MKWLGMALLFLPGLAAAAIYQVVDDPDEFVGAWDVNILADDVHFEVPSVLREIRMPIAIAGEQTCALWIFDELDSDPLYVEGFTNVPAVTNTDSSEYVFSMQVQVPKDIYIGFSAEGGGWNYPAGADYWGTGFEVSDGVAGTPGEYYYGPMSGGQLTTVYSPANGTYGTLEILAEPVRTTNMAVVTGQVTLAFANLPIHATNDVERSPAAGGANWQARGTLTAGASNAVWSEAVPAASSSLFYRVRSR